MVRKLQKYMPFVFLLPAFFLTRLYNIMSSPIFTDEAIYTRWSQIARFDPSWRFISLTDGKQPLFVWADMVFMRFVSDPLLAGRLVSVFAGFFSMLGLFFLGRELFKNQKIGLVCAALYLLYPFSLVYDRMALYDSLVGTFFVWSLFLIVLLVRKARLDISLLLGMVAGGGILTKSSGFFSLYLLPLSLLLFDWRRKQLFSRFLRWLFLALISVVVAYLYYSIQRLSPFFHIIAEKNAVFIYPFSEWVRHPFTYLFGNIRGLWDWFITYFSWPVLFLVIFSFKNKEYYREKIMLFLWFAIPFFALALFGRILYPRFILFMTLPLFPLAAFSLVKLMHFIKNKMLFAFCFLLFVFFYLRADFLILTNFAYAPIPKADLEQYINGWPAGGGIREVISFLSKQAEKQKIFVVSLGTFGSLPTYSTEIYLGNNKNVEYKGIYPIPEQVPEDILKKAKIMPVYLFFSNQEEFLSKITNWPLRLLFEHKKGIGNSYTRLYEVVSQ